MKDIRVRKFMYASMEVQLEDEDKEAEKIKKGGK